MKMFKELTQKEETEFKDWAKLNYKPFEPIKGIWHPIIQAECVKMNDAYGSCEGTCDSCSHEMTVEPDGDYPCPECGKGRVTSPLIRAGLI